MRNTSAFVLIIALLGLFLRAEGEALDEENMEWEQLRLVGPEALKAAVGYGISTVPYLIAPDGRILCVTNDPEEVAGRLQENVK